MSNDCGVLKKNLGLSRCNKMPSMPRCMITTSASFKFAAADYVSSSAFAAALDAAIQAGYATRIYLWPNFKGFQNVSEDAIYEETPLADMKVRDGKYRFRFDITENICLHKAMFTHRANGGRAFIFDIENQLIGTVDSAGNFYGFTISLLNTEKMIISDGAVASKSPIYLVLANNKELDQDGMVLGADIASVINTTARLTDVALTLISHTATVITVEVKQSCDGTGVEGLLTADFLLVDDDNGASHSLTAAAVSGTPGRYTLTGTAFEASVLSLRPPATLTAKAYELEASLVIPA
jgi:hypothetical protein